VLVTGLTPQRDRVLRGCPKLVIPRHPNDRVEPITQGPQCPVDLGDHLCYIPTNDQPIIVRLRTQACDDLMIFAITHVYITDPEQPATRCHIIGDHPADSTDLRPRLA
jgi:hypothetical protein